MRRGRGVKIVAGFLSIALLLCGCERPCDPAPELVAPLAGGEESRLVVRGRIGEVENVTGHVMPKEYCYFWEESVQISELLVRVGDSVQVGDVLARVDTAYLTETINELKKDKALEAQLFLIDEEAYAYRHQELEYASTYAYENHQDEAVKQYDKMIRELEENHRFDGLLHEYKQKEFSKKIAEYNRMMEGSELIATASGVVTYCKDITKSVFTDSSENVVVISDMEDCYIELEQEVTPKKEDEKWKVKTAVAYVNGEAYELEEYEYTPMERAAMENRKQFMLVRYEMKDPSKMPKVGEDVLISIGKDTISDALLVGNDSIYLDAQGFYVYVDNDGQKEKRRVEIGAEDISNKQILSGLQEGEKVFYNSPPNTMWDCDWTTPVRKDYGVAVSYDAYEKAKLLIHEKISDLSCSVEEIMVKSGTAVKKGDVIFSVRTEIGHAKLAQLEYEGQTLTKGYEDRNKGFDEQQKEIGKAKEENEKQRIAELTEISRWYNEMLLLPEPPEGLQEEFDRRVADVNRWYGYLEEQCNLQSLQVECERKKAEAEYNLEKERFQKEFSRAKKNNDGKGIVQVCAEKDGIITYDKLVKNYQIHEGEILYQIWEEQQDMLSFRNKKKLSLAKDIEFYNSEKKLVGTGTIVAVSGDTKWHCTTKSDYVYLTENKNNDEENYTYYVKLNQPEILASDEKLSIFFYEFRYKNILTVPKVAVEWDPVDAVNIGSAYVWVREGKKLIKHYVNVGGLNTYGEDDWYLLGGIGEEDVIQTFNAFSW